MARLIEQELLEALESIVDMDEQLECLDFEARDRERTARVARVRKLIADARKPVRGRIVLEVRVRDGATQAKADQLAELLSVTDGNHGCLIRSICAVAPKWMWDRA
jgi:hypothetical protein